MNTALLIALGITGLSAAAAARRILQEKRRIHQRFTRSGGQITGDARGDETKRHELLMRLNNEPSMSNADLQTIIANLYNAGATEEQIDQATRGAYTGEPMEGLRGIGNYEFIGRPRQMRF